MDSLISTAEADAIIASSLTIPTSELVPLTQSIGRTLSASIQADRDLPPYSRSMMDGIAFASSHFDPTRPLHFAGLHAAGDPPPPELGEGEVWEIMTGACLPEDCDTVVPYEHLNEDRTVLVEPFEVGQFIHRAGSDAQAGEILVPADQAVGPAEIAIAASVGLSALQVAMRPRVVLISSGDEAVPVDDDPEPWQIRRSNGPMLEALLHQLGYPPSLHHHIPDDESLARPVIHEAVRSGDIIILCGGISKGKRDIIRPLLEEKLGPPAFHGVLQRPGKPLAFWSGPPFVFALPGNPVSVLATFTRYVIPALYQLEGRDVPPHPISMPGGFAPLPRLTWLLPITRTGIPVPPRNSGDFVSIAGVAGFVEIPAEADFSADQPLAYYPFNNV